MPPCIWSCIALPCWGGVAEAERGRRAPSEARLQLARRPLMIGVASAQAFLAASGSLNVTYMHITFKGHASRMQIIYATRNETYKSVAFGSAG